MALAHNRILAIDYGQKRVGFSASDALGITAQPLKTYLNKTEDDLIQHISSLLEEKQISKILIGLPINMDGTSGPKAEEAKQFAERLRTAVTIPVELWDERLTSWQAEGYLKEAGLSLKKQRKKGRVDQIAAQIILQNYMEAHRKS